MKSFYEKEEYSFEDIQSLIENEVEESIYLDFKEAAALEKNDGKRKDISKDVASFANSDGGIIIYGIKEENHKAHSTTFINGNEFTKEWLEQVINSTIQRHIPDLKIYPIREGGRIENTIYIIKIPKSLEAPHLSKDQRFYKRFNFMSVPMEEYEIRQLYGRTNKSKLSLNQFYISILINKPEDKNTQILCEVTIGNDGNVIESAYKVNIYINPFKDYLHVHWANNVNYHYTISWCNNFVYTKLP